MIFQTNNIKFICKSEIKDEKAVYDKIEKSIISLFFLTNENSEDFISYYNFCQEVKASVILIRVDPLQVLPNIIEVNQLNVFDVNLLKQENLFQQFMLLVNKILKREDQFTFKINVEYSKTASIDEINGGTAFIEIPENNHLIIVIENNMKSQTKLYIFNQSTFNFIKKIELSVDKKNFPIHSNTVSYIKCLDQFYFVKMACLYAISRDYETITLIKEFQEINNWFYSYICHDETSANTYILNLHRNTLVTFKAKDLERSKAQKMKNLPKDLKAMKLINNHLYFLSKEDIRVFDLNSNYIGKFGDMNLKNALNMNQIGKSDYFYVFQGNELKIFNTNNFKYRGSIYLNGGIRNYEETHYLVCNNTIVNTFDEFIYQFSGVIPIFKINFSTLSRKRVEDDLNSKFICSIKPFNRHLFLDPHELPCGYISCLKCLYDNYNLLTNEFKCPFEKCASQFHFLKNQMIKLNIIENNLGEITANQIHYIKKRYCDLTIDYGNI